MEKESWDTKKMARGAIWLDRRPVLCMQLIMKDGILDSM
jgi:hypothetical protein